MFSHSPSQGDLSFSLLLRALRGITLWQPILVYILAVFIGMAGLEFFIQWPGGIIGASIGLLILFISFGVGYLGAGGVLLHEARGDALPGILHSLRFGLKTLPRLIGLLVIESLLLLGIFVVELLGFLACKIPGIGAILFVPLFPLTMLMNAVVFVLAIIVFNLSGPALWHGESVSNSLRHTLSIARNKPGSILLMMLLLGALSAGLAIIIAIILYTGYSMALSAAAPALASELSRSADMFWQMMDALSGYPLITHSAAPIAPTGNIALYNVGLSMGMGVATALVFIIPNIVFLLGMAHIYIEALELVAPEDV
ncbi:hypothetical protein B1757_01025 [Acidithiobacillus marinus]|uniref:Uncharacterized protein n=1 Tax=Acidithiobacillus marinus TaxID=187490 RepID=A0A2I1DQ29_9PROT|nr:hypothetical protein [Acidithiobacillus marinus]PKY11966.1 hypothetical protein B1757_01025 [Acidithiobacillus marinus]